MTSIFTPKYLSKIGKRGGLATKKKQGKKFFSNISKNRKHFRGGRPRKDGQPIKYSRSTPPAPKKPAFKKITPKQAKAILASLD